MQDPFDPIRYYHAEEVQPALQSMLKHPMMQAMMKFTFPELPQNAYEKILKTIFSIEDFQDKIISQSILKILELSSDGLSVSGLENIDVNKTHLYISNHRDILLDTSLINLALLQNDFQLTASAIGDNLVNRDIFMVLGKLNRNFLVKRDVSPRDLLKSSQLLSEYIQHLVLDKKQSVWIAQREGRTKDGNDATNSGVLKMLNMTNGKNNVCDYFSKLNIIPVSISYEFDPTDKLKTYKAHQSHHSKSIAKHKNEDFDNVMAGVLGQKKRIHIHFGKCINQDLALISSSADNNNQRIQCITKKIDDQIIGNFYLFPNNFIAYDLQNNTNQYKGKYTDKEKDFFVRRLEMSIDKTDNYLLRHYLGMYANPVANKLKLGIIL